ncbi:MAG: NAD(P)-dependent oxidoreductase [Sulfuritalea sp.]|nr:NAD(P)-dependent oxidoreductase [Sulfuritalea sp.]
MNMKSIGIIGVGNMGLPMLKALHRAGFQVTARDLRSDAETAAREAGARIAASARDLAASSDMILVVVVDAGQIEDALFREAEPAAQGWRPGTLVALCSTISPEDAERLAAHVVAAGAEVLDAPVSGGPVRAEAGQLSLMLAGSDDVLKRAEPVLSALGNKRFRVSNHPGDGARMKLVNNLLAGINLAAGAEVLALGESLGLDPQIMLAVLGASSGQSWIVDERMPRAFAGDFAARAHARILLKDVTLAVGMAREAGSESTLGEPALDLFRETVERGWGAEDDAVLLRTARQRITESFARIKSDGESD